MGRGGRVKAWNANTFPSLAFIYHPKCRMSKPSGVQRLNKRVHSLLPRSEGKAPDERFEETSRAAPALAPRIS